MTEMKLTVRINVYLNLKQANAILELLQDWSQATSRPISKHVNQS